MSQFILLSQSTVQIKASVNSSILFLFMFTAMNHVLYYCNKTCLLHKKIHVQLFSYYYNLQCRYKL